MNSKKRNILISLVVVVCIFATWLGLTLTAPNGDSLVTTVTKPNSSSQKVQLLEFKQDDVLTVEVHTENEVFNIERTGKEQWQVKELEGIPQASSLVSALTNIASTLKAKQLVEKDAQDLAKYGLENSKNFAVITYKDASESVKTIHIGVQSTVESQYRYVRIDDSRDVYLVAESSLGYFMSNKEAYIDLCVLATPSDETWPTIDTITVERKDWSYDLIFEDDTVDEDSDIPGMAATQVITSPIYAYLDVTNSSSITHGMWGLTALEAVVIHPQLDDKFVAGLHEPTAVVTIEAELKTYKLTIGSPVYQQDENGKDTNTVLYYYGYFDGIDVIYRFAASSVPWATFEIIDITSTMMTSNYIYLLDEINISVTDGKNDADHVIEIDSDLEGKKLNEVKFDGTTIKEDTFKLFYQYLLKCPADEIHMEDPTGEKVLTIEIKTTDGGGDVLEFYKDTSRRTIVKLNGKTSFRIHSDYIDVFLENIESAKLDGDINMEW